jgi:hypothetical protein
MQDEDILGEDRGQALAQQFFLSQRRQPERYSESRLMQRPRARGGRDPPQWRHRT